jgi:HPt (histidine-containing phosphotransfer) domain-containing protein
MKTVDMTGSQPGLLDLARVLDRVGGDQDLLKEIAEIFLEEYPGLLQEIREAVKSGDSQRLERAAHSLKGSVSNFGVQPATQAALQLEQLGRRGQVKGSAEALTVLERQLRLLDSALNELIASVSKF